MAEDEVNEVSFPEEGSFTINEKTQVYPSVNSKIMVVRKGFNSVHVNATLVNAHLRIKHHGSVCVSHLIHPIPGTDKVNDTAPFPFLDNSGYLTFEVEQIDKNKPEFSANIRFWLDTISNEMYDALSKKYLLK